MQNIETYSNKTLQINYEENDSGVLLTWKGRSTERDPNIFIAPILKKALIEGNNHKKIVMDFHELDYMNSSTISPISKMINMIRKNSGTIRIIYNKSIKWHSLFFSTLKIFETEDKRVEIQGI
jgi:hypothetical protein